MREDRDSSCAVVVVVVVAAVDEAVGPPRVPVRAVIWDVRCSRVGSTGCNCGWASFAAKNGFEPLEIPNAASIRVRRVSKDAACSRRPDDGAVNVAGEETPFFSAVLVSFDVFTAAANFRERIASDVALARVDE